MSFGPTPRIKRGPPPPKRRKIEQPQALTYDPDARQEYLTGFHKRKLQRIKRSQEEAAKLAKDERVTARRQLREQRKEDLEKHVAEVNALLRKANPDLAENGAESGNEEDGEWIGISEPPAVNGVDEYVDEEKYTTVTIEAMEDPRNMQEADSEAHDKEEGVTAPKTPDGSQTKKRPWSKRKPDGSKPKKKKFRYESKGERKATRQKQKARNSGQAKMRREK
ncbi:hypothetical protein LTR66_008867 [Elasticomyces elasticus]|nr:hypothetical protein LTR66_008867 [Elasticomyces elasticus]